MTNRSPHEPSTEIGSFSNHEVIVLAVYLVGGRNRYVDSEDVAIKANQIAPNRFSWKKHKEQVDIFAVRSALSDARKAKNNACLIGSNRQGWLLTPVGIQLAKRRLKRMEGIDLAGSRQTARERAWHQRERLRLASEVAFQKFEEGKLDDVTAPEAERFFRLDDYIKGPAREAKIARLATAFAGDRDFGRAILALAPLVRGR